MKISKAFRKLCVSKYKKLNRLSFFPPGIAACVSNPFFGGKNKKVYNPESALGFIVISTC